jgi:hypothetical protein
MCGHEALGDIFDQVPDPVVKKKQRHQRGKGNVG